MISVSLLYIDTYKSSTTSSYKKQCGDYGWDKLTFAIPDRLPLQVSSIDVIQMDTAESSDILRLIY